MTDAATHVDRADFARMVSAIIIVSARAIEQAIDPTQDHPTVADVKHYGDTIRRTLAALEGEPDPPPNRP